VAGLAWKLDEVGSRLYRNSLGIYLASDMTVSAWEARAPELAAGGNSQARRDDIAR